MKDHSVVCSLTSAVALDFKGYHTHRGTKVSREYSTTKPMWKCWWFYWTTEVRVLCSSSQWWIKVVWGPWLKHRKGPFLYFVALFTYYTILRTWGLGAPGCSPATHTPLNPPLTSIWEDTYTRHHDQEGVHYHKYALVFTPLKFFVGFSLLSIFFSSLWPWCPKHALSLLNG